MNAIYDTLKIIERNFSFSYPLFSLCYIDIVAGAIMSEGIILQKLYHYVNIHYSVHLVLSLNTLKMLFSPP